MEILDFEYQILCINYVFKNVTPAKANRDIYIDIKKLTLFIIFVCKTFDIKNRILDTENTLISRIYF